MNRSRSIERTGQLAWVICVATATVLLSWAIGSASPGLMLPAVFAVAIGFYASLHGRQQTRLVAGYVEEFIEGRADGPHWYTRLGHLQVVPTVSPNNDWLLTGLSNLVMLATVVLSWLYAEGAERGELMAGLVTASCVAFAVHSITETVRMRQTDYAALWRQVSSGPREVRRQSGAGAS
jgi:hypothetical protein